MTTITQDSKAALASRSSLIIHPLEDTSQTEVEVNDFEDEPQRLILPTSALTGIKLTNKLGSGTSGTVYEGITSEGTKVAVKISFDEREAKVYKAFSDIAVTPKFYSVTETKGEWQVDPDRPLPAGLNGPTDTPVPINVFLIVTGRMDMTLKQAIETGDAKQYMGQIAEQMLDIYKKIDDAKYAYGDWSINNVMLKFNTENKSVEVKLVDFEDAEIDLKISEEYRKERYQAFVKWVDELRKGDITRSYFRY